MFSRFSVLPAFILFLFLAQTQTAHAQCCPYTLSMHDSYGDGWNGGFLQLYVNDTLRGNFSASNYASAATFLACEGDSIVLVYTPGMYEEENTYQLFNPAWNLVFANGPNPQTGAAFSFTGTCSAITVPGSHPCTAIPIDTGQCILADNTDAIGSGMNGGCAEYQGADIWFTMKVPVSGSLGLSTQNGTLNDTGIAVWSDTSCTNLQRLTCDDDGGPGYYSQVNLYDLKPGQTLYIQVYGYGGGKGSFELCAKDNGKINLESSELPLVLINTQGKTIVPDVKIDALMDIKYNGPNNLTYLTDPANVYSGNVGIEVRGASSSGYPQQPFGFETRNADGSNQDVSILNMPAENDWVLLSNFNDRSLIRNPLAYRIFGQMGQYSPRMQLCEVLIDSSYKGIYVLGEKIKRDKNRVDIAKLTQADNEGDDVTGGYIIMQNNWDPSNSFQSNYSPINHPGFDIHFVYEYPKPDSLTAPQKTYIASYVDSLETALYSAEFADTLTGYRKYLDVKSFIDYFIVNEVARNADGFKKSVFFHKDKYSKGGKLKAGPIWDFDWAWKNITECAMYGVIDGSGWAYQRNECPTDVYSCEWYTRMLQDTSFNNELRCTYEAYRQTILDTTVIFSYIDSVRTLVHNAQARHFQRWPILGVSGPAPEIEPVATTYDAELDTLKAWISTRLQWLDAHIPGNCTLVSAAPEPSALRNALQFYPNPSSTGVVHFEGFIPDNTPLTLRFYRMTGEQVGTKELIPGTVKFEFQLQAPGVYFFELVGAQGVMQTGRVVGF
jgi:hypothetical protein